VNIRIIVGAIAALVMIFVGVTPAQALTQSTKVSIEVPAYAAKGTPTDIFIHVCSGPNCTPVTRGISVYVDGKKMRTWNSPSNTLQYSWKSTSVTKHSIQVKVSARLGFKGASSAVKKISVKTGMLNSRNTDWGATTQCESALCTFFPVEIYPSDVMPSLKVWLGTDYRQYDRQVNLQWQKSDGTWSNDDWDYATWDEDAGSYFVELRFDWPRADYCPEFDGSEWAYRILMPATSRATQTTGFNRSMHLNCGDAYPASGTVVADFDYKDQLSSEPGSMWFYPQDPDATGFTLSTEYCVPDIDDCSLAESWVEYDAKHFDEDPYDWIDVSVRPEYSYTLEYVRGVVTPDDGSTVLYSAIYSVIP
jgi:hypothetical protein